MFSLVEYYRRVARIEESLARRASIEPVERCPVFLAAGIGLFVMAIGSNAALYHSASFPWAGYLVVSTAAFLMTWLVASRRGRLLLPSMWSFDVLLWGALVTLPLACMCWSAREFSRGAWTSQIAVDAVFFAAVVVGLRRDLRGTVVLWVIGVIAMSTFLNVYELMVQNNRWSVAPGRSAGWYENPNLSSAALTLYGILYFSFRRREARRLDLLVLLLVFTGVLATFSRGGAALFGLCVVSCVLARGRLRLSWLSLKWVLLVCMSMVVLGWLAFSVVIPHLNLTEDAKVRLDSIMGNALVRDYGTNRADGLRYGWRVFQESPWTGVGVRTSLEVEQGPHNMMAGLAMDMGVGAVVLYVVAVSWMIARGIGQWRRGVGVANSWLVAIWLLAYGFSSHNVLYEAALVLGLGLAIGGMRRNEVRRRRRDNRRLIARGALQVFR